MIFHVLSEIQDNPNLDEVLKHVDLPFNKNFAKDILLSKGFLKPISKNTNEVEITDYGLFRLSGVEWVGFYEMCLDYFDFDDFERYMQNNDVRNVVKNALNYLDENQKMAYDQKDFYRLHDVFSSKALIHVNNQNFKEALNEELKLFILKLNPIYLDKNDLKTYDAIEYPNINNILELHDLAEINNLKDAFYNSWDEMKLEKMLMTKNDAFQYLTKTCNGETLDELSIEINKKYL